MGQVEAPCSRSSLFMIGQNRQGNWVVQDQRGMCGGIFFNRTEALRLAIENGHRPQGVLMGPRVFELDMNRDAGNVARLPLNIGSHYKRRAA